MIPRWLGEKQTDPLDGDPGGRRRQSFLEKTVDSVARVAEKLFRDDTCPAGGWLGRLEPRCKLIAFLLLIITVSLFRSPSVAWGAYGGVLLLVAGVGGSLRVWHRWLLLPLWTAVIALPVLLNVITPGEPLWVVARFEAGRDFGPYHIPAVIAVTDRGLRGFALLVGRVGGAVTLAGLLTMTTRWDRFLGALTVLRVPHLFVLTLAMTYRYLALLVRAVGEMCEARRSRTLRYLAAGAERRWAASRIGFLFEKSWRMGEEVHEAMLARGFAGEIRPFGARRPASGDIVFLATVLFLCGGMLLADRSF